MELKQIIKDLAENKTVVQTVNSTNISTVGYNPNNKKLIILFQRGNIYKYDNVNLDTFLKLLLSDSIGQGFHKFINNKFNFTRIGKDGRELYTKMC